MILGQLVSELQCLSSFDFEPRVKKLGKSLMVQEMIVLAADVLLCDLVREGEALCLIQF